MRALGACKHSPPLACVKKRKKHYACFLKCLRIMHENAVLALMPGSQKLGNLSYRNRGRDQKALDDIATCSHDECQIPFIFHPLGHHCRAQLFGQVMAGPEDSRAPFVPTHSLHELFIDLDLIDIQMNQFLQVCVSRSKIINRKTNTTAFQLADQSSNLLKVCQSSCFRQFQRDSFPRELPPPQFSPQESTQIRDMGKVFSREIDGHADRQTAPVPTGRLSDGFTQNLLGDRRDEPAAFCGANELIGPQKADLRMFPAHECLKTQYFTRAQIHLRLIEIDELAIHECQNEVVHHLTECGFR